MDSQYYDERLEYEALMVCIRICCDYTKKFVNDGESLIVFSKYLSKAISRYGNKFAVGLAFYSKDVLHNNDLAYLTAAVLNNFDWVSKRLFFENVFTSIDGIAQTFELVDKLTCKKSHAMLKAAKLYLESCMDKELSDFTYANYEYNLNDLINLTHPFSYAICRYKNGLLKKQKKPEQKEPIPIDVRGGIEDLLNGDLTSVYSKLLNHIELHQYV